MTSEQERLATALNGRFIFPSTGGDPLVNPDSLPTGRNIAGVNIERTPDETTFQEAERLTAEGIELEWPEDLRLEEGDPHIHAIMSASDLGRRSPL